MFLGQGIKECVMIAANIIDVLKKKSVHFNQLPTSIFFMTGMDSKINWKKKTHF